MRAWILSYRPRRLEMLSVPFVEFAGENRFVFRSRDARFGGDLAFDWHPLDSFLPALRGKIRLHRFGPLVILAIDARFRTAADAAGRLLSQSVGQAMATRSMRYLCNAIRLIITTAPSRTAAGKTA